LEMCESGLKDAEEEIERYKTDGAPSFVLRAALSKTAPPPDAGQHDCGKQPGDCEAHCAPDAGQGLPINMSMLRDKIGHEFEQFIPNDDCSAPAGHEPLIGHAFRSHEESNTGRYMPRNECDDVNTCHVSGCSRPRSAHAR
jgi:hypothetical protein